MSPITFVSRYYYYSHLLTTRSPLVDAQVGTTTSVHQPSVDALVVVGRRLRQGRVTEVGTTVLATIVVVAIETTFVLVRWIARWEKKTGYYLWRFIKLWWYTSTIRIQKKERESRHTIAIHGTRYIAADKESRWLIDSPHYKCIFYVAQYPVRWAARALYICNSAVRLSVTHPWQMFVHDVLACTQSVDNICHTLKVLWEKEYFLNSNQFCSAPAWSRALWLFYFSQLFCVWDKVQHKHCIINYYTQLSITMYICLICHSKLFLPSAA